MGLHGVAQGRTEARGTAAKTNETKKRTRPRPKTKQLKQARGTGAAICGVGVVGLTFNNPLAGLTAVNN
jgi:hypothetical protein